MSKTTTTKISFRRLADAFESDWRNLGGRHAGGERQENPFPSVTKALGDLTEGLREIQEAVVEQRQKHDQARAQLLQESLKQDQAEIENAADLRAAETAKPAAGKFVTAGRVIDANSGVGLPDVRVQLTAGEAAKAKVLSESVTEDLGFYRHELGQVKTSDDGAITTVAVRVVDAGGKLVHLCDQRLTPKPGEVALVDIALDAAKLPGSLARGQRHEQDAAVRLDAVQRQCVVLAGRSRLRLGLGLSRKEEETEKRPPKKATYDFTRIKGIGPIFAARLQEYGIADAEEVASLKPAQLAEILEVSVEKAKEIKKSAREVAKGGE